MGLNNIDTFNKRNIEMLLNVDVIKRKFSTFRCEMISNARRNYIL